MQRPSRALCEADKSKPRFGDTAGVSDSDAGQRSTHPISEFELLTPNLCETLRSTVAFILLLSHVTCFFVIELVPQTGREYPCFKDRSL